jgi:hypothetical protein
VIAQNRRVRLRGLALLTGPLALVVLIGCGDSTGLEKRYPVSGKVTYKGQPVPKGNVFFVPVDATKGRSAGGEIAEDGSYTLTTAEEGDGALPGEYKVAVISQDIDMTEVLKEAGGGAGRQSETFRKATKQAKYLVPKKYSDPETSGLKKTVEARSNTIDLELSD